MGINVTIHFQCSGCNEEADVEAKVVREFVSFSGRGHGFGRESTVWPTLDESAPQGWIAFDPYTYCTYCPDCWKSIQDGAS